MDHKHLTPVAVSAMHAVTNLLCFNDLCKPIEIYIYVRKRHPFTSYLAARHPKHKKNLRLQMNEKKPVDFFK